MAFGRGLHDAMGLRAASILHDWIVLLMGVAPGAETVNRDMSADGQVFLAVQYDVRLRIRI